MPTLCFGIGQNHLITCPLEGLDLDALCFCKVHNAPVIVISVGLGKQAFCKSTTGNYTYKTIIKGTGHVLGLTICS